MAERPKHDPASPAITAEPNPFRTQTALRFSVGGAAHAWLLVFNAAGHRVRAWDCGAGGNSVVWDGKDDDGRSVPAGVYAIIAETGQSLDRVKVLKLE